MCKFKNFELNTLINNIRKEFNSVCWVKSRFNLRTIVITENRSKQTFMIDVFHIKEMFSPFVNKWRGKPRTNIWENQVHENTSSQSAQALLWGTSDILFTSECRLWITWQLYLWDWGEKLPHSMDTSCCFCMSGG